MKPEVYAIRRERSGWKLSRRNLASAAALAGAAAVEGCRSEVERVLPPSPCRGALSHAQRVLGLAFTRDGKRLASSSTDGLVKYWTIPEGRLQETENYLSDTAQALAAMPDGSILVRQATAIAASASGRIVATAYWGSSVGWQTKGPQWQEGGNVNHPATRAVALTPAGNLMATASSVSTIKLWSIPGGKLLKTLDGHKDEVRALAITGDGRTLVSAGWDGTVRLWSLPGGAPIRTMEAQAGKLNAVAITPDGKLVAAAGTGQAIGVWAMTGGERAATLAGHVGAVNALAISPDGRVIASGGDDQTVKLWSLPDGKPLPGCLIGMPASTEEVKAVEYVERGVNHTVPCGTPVPAGAICTCNCVMGRGIRPCGCVADQACSCVGHVTCSCVGHSGGGGGIHYWYPN